MSLFREALPDGRPGTLSMRRVLALFFAIASVGSGFYAIFKQSTAQITLIAFGIPAVACIVLMFFTTWGDIQKTIASIKGTPTQGPEDKPVQP